MKNSLLVLAVFLCFGGSLSAQSDVAAGPAEPKPALGKTTQTSLGLQYGFDRSSEINSHAGSFNLIQRFNNAFAIGVQVGAVRSIVPEIGPPYVYRQANVIRTRSFGLVTRHYLTRGGAFEMFLESGLAFQYLAERPERQTDFEPIGRLDKRLDLVAVGAAPGVSYTRHRVRVMGYLLHVAYGRLINQIDTFDKPIDSAKSDFAVGITPTLGAELLF